MMRKTSRILVAVLILMLLAPSACSGTDRSYASAIEANWSIKLPDGCKEIYSKQSEADFHGDGERYHVFDCSNAEGMLDLVEWYNEAITSNDSNYILNRLEVSEADRFQPGAYKEYTRKNVDGSLLILLYSPETQLLYVLEEFF